MQVYNMINSRHTPVESIRAIRPAQPQFQPYEVFGNPLNHGDPNLQCVPTRWSDVIIFFLGNYIAHAATVVQYPGSAPIVSIQNVFYALLFPVTGTTRGLKSIASCAVFYMHKSDLECAARAGALVKVVKLSDYARTDREKALMGRQDNRGWLRSGQVHGRIYVPRGYGLALVPKNSKFIEDTSKKGTNPQTVLSVEYNAIKILVAIGQLCFAITTLYRARGNQVDVYGYAAFGLTVTQYALMSFINLLGNLCCPQYSAVYLVKTHLMREAQNYDGIFEGVVGTLVEDTQNYERDTCEASQGGALRSMIKNSWRLPLVWVPTAISIIIIWALSRFRAGHSTVVQRAVLMAWLAVGSYVGAMGLEDRRHDSKEEERKRRRHRPLRLATIGIFAVPIIWGYIIVGQMLIHYGTCTVH
ncbi:hypothetical protein BT63DRAFT_476594 [Microthyrium microscopicum]|uniref:Uncharacterized protein n=1 Tax=Microthyrium microscopicum TaxID=703497 RepID=A0A6A6UIW2_9PEZI|nr:hypothetical protein BT63DRAFT_476594 [Microthyrium microscopicum]